MKCEECSEKVSDKAAACPKCGAPLASASPLTVDLASRWKRLGGALIDCLIMITIIVPIGLATGVFQQLFSGMAMTSGEHAISGVTGWVVFLILNGYLLHHKGQTIGKVVVKTRIVDLNGHVPNFGKLLVLRYLILGLVYQIPIVGAIASFVNPLFIFGKDRRCLHDYMAGTRVINA